MNNNNLTKLMALAVVGTGIITLQSCKKYDDGPGLSLRSKKARLAGEWELTGGDWATSLDLLGYDSWEVIYEFSKDGDFEVNVSFTETYEIYSYPGGYSDTTVTDSYKDKGEWDWGRDKESIEIDWDELGQLDTELDINRLSNKEFWGEDFLGFDFEFEKL